MQWIAWFLLGGIAFGDAERIIEQNARQRLADLQAYIEANPEAKDLDVAYAALVEDHERMGEDEEANTEKRRMAALVSVLVLVVTGGAVLDSFGDTALNRSAPSLTSEIGDTIFSQYIVPFEAVSVLLLAALIGAIVVARKD